MRIKKIIESSEAAEYILSRGLLGQYRKAKSYLLEGYLSIVDFKLRQPKNKGIYQFRINQKYRGFAYIEDDEALVIFKISDHQD